MKNLSLVAMIAFLVIAVAETSVSRAASVMFRGVIDNYSGTAQPSIGAIPPLRDFSLTVDFTPSNVLTFATVTGGQMNIQGPAVNFGVTSGVIAVNGNTSPTADSAQFALNLAGGGLLAFNSLQNTSVPVGATATAANIQTIIEGATANFVLDFGGGVTYSGTITGIPEPSSTAVLLGLVVSGGAWRWRQRRSRKLAAQPAA